MSPSQQPSISVGQYIYSKKETNQDASSIKYTFILLIKFRIGLEIELLITM